MQSNQHCRLSSAVASRGRIRFRELALVSFQPICTPSCLTAPFWSNPPMQRKWRCVRHTKKECWLRSEEHTSELQSLMRISYAVFCLKKKKKEQHINQRNR